MDRPAPDFVALPSRVPAAGLVIDLSQEALLDAQGRPVDLRPQAWQVLRHLAIHAGRLVTKEELLAAVWPGVVVTDDSLVQAIGNVRRALGEAGHRSVRTVPRRGYMLVADPAIGVQAPVEGEATRAGPGRTWPWVSGALLVVLLVIVAVWWASARDRDATPGIAADGSLPSIAVLPFKGPSGDADGAALARDVAADLVSELARSPDLRVVSSQSSFQFGDGKTPLAEIGRRLRSRHVVDGSVRREGERLRMVVELLDSEDGRVVWSYTDMVDQLTLGAAQLALVGRIAGTLQSKVARTEHQRALAQPPKTLDTYVLVAHGRAMLQRYDAQGMRDSRRVFEQALAIDPDYAPAWAYLGITNTVDIGLHMTGEWDETRIGEVLTQIRRAIALQPNLPIAHHALSQAQSRAGNLDAALAAAEQGCQLSPNDAACFFTLGAAQLQLGRSEPAERNLEQAMNRNPLPPAYLPAFYATALWANRRFEETIRVADNCLDRAPDFWRCRQDRIAALVELGRLPEAREEATVLRVKVPRLTSAWFGSTFGDAAAVLRARRVGAAQAAGIPDTATASP